MTKRWITLSVISAVGFLGGLNLSRAAPVNKLGPTTTVFGAACKSDETWIFGADFKK